MNIKRKGRPQKKRGIEKKDKKENTARRKLNKHKDKKK